MRRAVLGLCRYRETAIYRFTIAHVIILAAVIIRARAILTIHCDSKSSFLILVVHTGIALAIIVRSTIISSFVGSCT